MSTEPNRLSAAAARYGQNLRYHGADAPVTIKARRDLAALQLETAIERIVADAPPLTETQADRLAGIIARSAR